MSDDFGNLDAAVAAQQAMQQQWAGSDFDAYRHELRLIANECAVVRPVGGPTEPHSYNVHALSPIPGREFGDKVVCLGPNLICCQKAAQERQAKGSRIKQLSGMAAMTVYSARIVFLVPQQGQSGQTYIRQEPYRVDAQNRPIYKDPNTKQTLLYPNGQHPLATGQYQWQEEGLKAWSGSTGEKAQNMARIFALAGEFRNRCKCGRTMGSVGITSAAVIRLQALSCANCGAQFPAPDPNAKITSIMCTTCGHNGRPEEVLACTASCGNPQRASLAACYLRIGRVGADKSTAYTFEPLPFSEPDPRHAAGLKKADGSPNCLDLAKLYAPSQRAMMEALAARGFSAGAEMVHPGGPAPMTPGQGFFAPGAQGGPSPFVAPGGPSSQQGFALTLPGPMAAPQQFPASGQFPAGPQGGPAPVPNFFTTQMNPPGVFQPPAGMQFKNL